MPEDPTPAMRYARHQAQTEAVPRRRRCLPALMEEQ